MFRKFLRHLDARRKWTRTRRWMRNRARSRCLVSLLYCNGVLRQI